jgi:hypothetical protein
MAAAAQAFEYPAQVTEIQQAIKAKLGYELKPSFISGFISADPANALQRSLDHAEWRIKNKVDTILVDTAPPKSDLIDKCCPCKLGHGVDLEGSPVYVEKIGQIATAALKANVSEDEYERHHIRGMETMVAVLDQQSAKLGRPVESFSVIMDLQGLGLGHRTIVNYFRRTTAIDTAHYPYLVKAVYWVNCGWFMPGFMGILKTFMPAWMMSRFNFVSGDPVGELSKVIELQYIPAEYGGQCKCSGGPLCVPVYDTSDLLQGDNDGYERANVAAGDTLVKSVDCGPAGASFSWTYESAGDYDIGFSVSVEEGGQSKVIVENDRMVNHKGTYTSAGVCTLKCKWDNTFSWVNSKDIKYFIGGDGVPNPVGNVKP